MLISLYTGTLMGINLLGSTNKVNGTKIQLSYTTNKTDS